MAYSCFKLTTAELAVLTATGYVVASGPHLTEAACLADCCDEILPTLVSATVASDGLTLTLVWSETVAWNGGSVSLSGGQTATATYVSGGGTNTHTFSLGVSGCSTIQSPSSLVIAIDADSVLDACGNLNMSITGAAVTNNSTQLDLPTLVSATIATDGVTLTLVWSEAVHYMTSTCSLFGGCAPTGTFTGGNYTTTMTYSLSCTVYSGEVLTVQVGGGDIVNSCGNGNLTISGAAVVNNSTQTP